LNGELFLKQYNADKSKTYPDWNSSFETFTNQSTLELETMGPITKLASGASIEHIEHWSLYKNIKEPKLFNDKELDEIFIPILQI